MEGAPLSLPTSCLKDIDIMVYLVLPCQASCHHLLLASCLCNACSYGIRLQYVLRLCHPTLACAMLAVVDGSCAVVMHMSRAFNPCGSMLLVIQGV